MLSKKYFNIVIIITLSFLLGWQLFRPGFYSMHDDLQVMRLFQMDKCFKDGQIPCRWSPDMGAGYGQPMFNYYSAFPYYFGEFFHLIGFSFVDVTKLLFLLCLMGMGLFSYLFFSELVSVSAALLGSLAYLFVPYHALDIFVRGALAESWALALLPLVMYFIVRLIKSPNTKNIISLSFSIFFFLITHNITSMISMFVFIPFTLVYLFLVNKNKKAYFSLFFAGLLGVGLSAFFTLPILFERQLVQTDFLVKDYYDFHQHFATLKQLFISSFWGYGASRLGGDDSISFAVGYLPTIFIFIFPVLAFVYRKKVSLSSLVLGSSFWLLSLFLIFMTHSRSVFIWDKLTFLSFVQFPWRFLGLASLCTSAVVAFVSSYLSNKFIKSVVIVTSFLLVILNWSFFRFEKYFPDVNDSNKLFGQEFIIQQKSALLDYLPVSSKAIPEQIAPSFPITSDQQINTNYFDKRSNYFSSEFDVYVDGVTVTFPVVYFPGWELYHNRLPELYQFTSDNELGLITVKLNRGHHLIQGFFENTPIRLLGNFFTFVSFAVIIFMLSKDYEKNKQ